MDKATQKSIEWQKANSPMAIGGGAFANMIDAYNVNPAFVAGYKEAERYLGWHSVKKSIPPVDEEVIVLTDDIHGKIVPDSHYICYGHIVDKNIAVDYDGWNIPGVTHWMYLPKLEEK